MATSAPPPWPQETHRPRTDADEHAGLHKLAAGRPKKRDGREPYRLAAVPAGLMADRAWELPAADGSVLDRWPDIAAP
ncbi:hypothetical protein AB0B79_09740 [Streptomyces sp. NPDC039022]|uniref:hypothetical protein n=1 Tax=unclassified Streptomyces TaxID=2593676 RepID=UPI00340FA7E1